MRRALASDLGKQLYRKRQQSIEPVYGHTKHNRKIYRFNYRGRQAVRTEWRLVMMTHNLTKLHRHQTAAVNGLKRPRGVIPIQSRAAAPARRLRPPIAPAATGLA